MGSVWNMMALAVAAVGAFAALLLDRAWGRFFVGFGYALLIGPAALFAYFILPLGLALIPAVNEAGGSSNAWFPISVTATLALALYASFHLALTRPRPDKVA